MKRIMILASLMLAVASGVYAQERTGWQRVLPGVHYFSPLIADVQEQRMALGLIQTDLFKRAPAGAERTPFLLPDPKDSEADTEVLASIGGSVPLLYLKEWPGHGGLVASAQLGVFARFRMEYPTRTDAGQDWYIGMPFEFTYDKWEGRFRIMHRSSHLGDELIETSFNTLHRIEFGGEFADFITAYHVAKDARVYGGGTWNFRSYTEYLPALTTRNRHDTAALQAGADFASYRWSDGHVGLVGGIDWQAQQRTNWRSMFALAGGIGMKVESGRASRVMARYYHGPSAMGEFFLTPETFWSLEWVVDF